MPRKKKEPLTFAQSMAKLRRAGISDGAAISGPSRISPDELALTPIADRISKILLIAEPMARGETSFLVLYDIADNKVRTLVAKYLIRLGCTRVQRSVFMARTSCAVYEQIRQDLAEVQASYDNDDSIIVMPISLDMLKTTKIIGKNVDMDIVARTVSTLFF